MEVAQVNQVLDKYFKHVNPSLAKLLKISGYALVEERAEGPYIWASGKRFMDFLGSYGAIVLGHKHPEVIETAKAQLDKMPLSSKVFLSPQLANLSERLAELSGLNYVFLCNSGAEAVEGAIKLALASTGKKIIISTYNSFHGKTLGALSVTGREVYKKGLPEFPWVSFVPYGEVKALEEKLNELGDDVAAVIVEPIQGEGGIVVPPNGYLKELRALTKSRGVLLIVDEVQTGMGRTGTFFAFQKEGIKPDIIALAKGLGGGVFPIGAIIGTEEVWKPLLQDPTFHTSTFGGNPLGSAIALKTIEIILRDRLPERAEKLGSQLLSSLSSLKEKYPDIITDVRGRGLMIGVELRDQGVAGALFYTLLRKGLLTAYTLNQPKVLRIEPPLTIPESLLGEALDIFESSLKEVREIL